jgi:hypothetical protein
MMRTFLYVVGMSCALSTAWATDEGKPAKKAARDFQTIDLQAKTNQKLKEQVHGANFPGNNLGALPEGEQTLAGVKFKIGAGYIWLASSKQPDMEEKVEGIKVDQRFARLHILHATGWATADATLIGEYTVTWEDDTSVTIPIIYGEDVCDWWFDENDPEPSRGKVAWKGENEASKGFNKGIRLYLTTWENPKPEKKVKTIDFSSAKTECGPFCVALTVEK